MLYLNRHLLYSRCYISFAMCYIPQKRCDMAHVWYSTPAIFHKRSDMAACYIAHVWYKNPDIYHKNVVIWQPAIYHLDPAIYHTKVWYGNILYAMPRYESSRKSCANQDVFLGPVVGDGRVAVSTMHLPLIPCCGRTVVFRAAAHWTSNCGWPVAALRAAGRAEWPPAFLQQAFGCGRTGNSHSSGFKFEVAAQPALSGAWRSRWDNLVWSCLAQYVR